MTAVLAIIPARGGSKGLPRKNVLPLGGKPLLVWTLEAAYASGLCDAIVVSSEDREILAVARAHGMTSAYVRPADLATDTATSLDVVLHCLDWHTGQGREFTHVMLLQPTSPLRNGDDIVGCWRRCESAGAPSCVSMCASEHPPHWFYTLDETGHCRPLLPDCGASRRQDFPPAFRLNGAVYLARVDWLRQHRSFMGAGTVAWVMPGERSIDIDTALDLQLAEVLIGAS